MPSSDGMEKVDSVLPNFELAELQSFPLTEFLKAKNQDLAKLMLTFCLVYNDLKDYMWFRYLFSDAVKKIDTTKRTKVLGQLNGMNEHCARMVIAHFLELLETIREYQKLYDCEEFKTILHYLKGKSKDFHDDWWILVRLANSKRDKNKFYNTLIRIRNNGTYHYRQIESIYQGLEYYVDKMETDALGYCSFGETLEKTRFYFGDAAIQYYHMKTTDEFGSDFTDRFSDYILKVNRVLRFIIEIYLTRILKVLKIS